MKKTNIKRLLFSFSALSLITLAGCNNETDSMDNEEVKEVTQLAEEETVSYSEQLKDLEERVISLYEEAEAPEDESTEPEVSEETEEADEEADVNLSEEEVSLENFEADENLKQDLKDLSEQVEDEEEKNQIQELQKDYGIIETMFNVKKALTDRFDAENQTVIEESELPSDFMMQLQSLEEIKPAFYEKYMALYEAFVASTGLESEQTEEDSSQARIDAIRNLVLNADGSVNAALSAAELQAYYEELMALGDTTTAVALAARLNSQTAEDSTADETAGEEANQPQADEPAESRSNRPSTTTPPRTTAPRPTPPSSSQPAGTGNQNPQPPAGSETPAPQPPVTETPPPAEPTPVQQQPDPFAPGTPVETSPDITTE